MQSNKRKPKQKKDLSTTAPAKNGNNRIDTQLPFGVLRHRSEKIDRQIYSK